MKVTIKENKSFKPVELNLVFETQAELNAFYAMASTHTSVPKTAQEHWGKYIPDTLILDNMLESIRDEVEYLIDGE
jgi:hypothetical protein